MIPRSRTPWLATLSLIAVLGLAVACGSGGAAPEPAAADHTSDAAASFRLSRVKTGLGDAIGVYHVLGQANRLYIVQKSGTIRVLQRGKLVEMANQFRRW